MSAILAQLSLDTWNPFTVCVTICFVAYVFTQCYVMILRTQRGDNTPTALEKQVQQLFDLHRQNASDLTAISKDLLPPAAVPAMIEGYVTAQLNAMRSKQQATAAAVAAAARQAPAPAQSPVTVVLEQNNAAADVPK
jgi:hypothetical protein